MMVDILSPAFLQLDKPTNGVWTKTQQNQDDLLVFNCLSDKLSNFLEEYNKIQCLYNIHNVWHTRKDVYMGKE